MKTIETRTGTALLLLTLLFACGPSLAGSTYEYHADARMQHAGSEDVGDAYGLVHVITDKRGHGFIRVLFSNGSELDRVRFNAQVRFLDDQGRVVHEEWFDRRIEAADSLGAGEREIKRLLELGDLTSMQVEFFLSDLPLTAVAGL